MRITESRLRSIIRSVIIEGMIKNTALDEFLKDKKTIKECGEALGEKCQHVAGSGDTAGIQTLDGVNVLTLDGNRINVSDEINKNERNNLLMFLKTCGILKNSKICDGVFYTPKGGSTHKLI